MPRPAKGPRLWYYKSEDVWVIRDAGQVFIRTSCRLGERESADKRLNQYLTDKFQPTVREGDLAQLYVAEVLTAYAREHAPHTRGKTPVTIGYNMAALLPFWEGKTLADVRASTCRAYAEKRRRKVVVRPDGSKKIVTVSDATIRRELSVLSSGIGHWHKEHGPLNAVPVVTMPEKPAGKERWLRRSEAALLLAGALGWYREFWSDTVTKNQHFRWRRHRPAINRHVARFILLGLYTGSRPGAIVGIRWLPSTIGGWVDIDAGVMHRRGVSETESKKRRPAVRLGKRILAHAIRWKRIDDETRLLAAQKRHAEDKPPVPAYLHIVTYHGQAVEKVRRGFDTAVEFAWLDDAVTPHVLRHTRATWLMQNRIDRWEAAGSLGMSIKTLEDTYGHHHPDWQKEAAEV